MEGNKSFQGLGKPKTISYISYKTFPPCLSNDPLSISIKQVCSKPDNTRSDGPPTEEQEGKEQKTFLSKSRSTQSLRVKQQIVCEFETKIEVVHQKQDGKLLDVNKICQ